MADISKELERILAAVFGKDVRGSIHDAIEKINDVSEKQLAAGTVIDSPTSSSEGFTDGSLYINTDVYELWRCLGTDSWESLGQFARAIDSIEYTSTLPDGLTDIYTITFSDGDTQTYEVKNGKDGLMWYRGTDITGNGSGITGAAGKKDDFYINTNTGYIYQCTQTGDETTALWAYVLALAGGPPVITVVDHLNSNDGNYALSARQGKILNEGKINLPENPTPGQVLIYDENLGWIAGSGGGHEMLPDPDDTEPADPEGAIVNQIISAMTSTGEGWANKNVGSLNSIGTWSNTMTKTYTVSGTATNSAIGTTGIGTWFNGDPEDIDPSTDEADWITIPELIGLGSNNDVDLKLTFDPSSCSIPIVLGGYIIDDTTGKMCIKFANEISDEDTTTAIVGIEIIHKRTETVPVSL